MYEIIKGSKNSKDILRNIAKIKNFSKEDILDFINFNLKFHNPYKLTNMENVIERIKEACYDGEYITIIGDYDVDGITSTYLLYKTLKLINDNVEYILPNRFYDGYGISESLINKSKGNLIITVDNGIKGHDAIKYANSLGKEVIVTDHHPSDLEIPTSLTINPQVDNTYPFKEICGCVVTYKLCYALLEDLNIYYDNEEYLQIITLATIADVMPLLDENRLIVHKGLISLNKEIKNLGLKVLINKLELNNIGTYELGFRINPCLNAAGRLEDPITALNLLLSKDEDEADKYANELIHLNKKRQDLTDKILNKINIDLTNDILIVHIEEESNKYIGIVGLIAGKISNKYKRPCIVVTGKGKLHGSGRSNGFPINRLIELPFVSGGGHSLACGIKFDEDKLKELQILSNKLYRSYNGKNESIKIIEINFNIINDNLINNINKLQPYGQDNLEPLFFTKNISITDYKLIGNDKFAKVNIMQNFKIFDGICFNSNLIDKLKYANSIVYTLNFNEWNGIKNIQLNIIDII